MAVLYRKFTPSWKHLGLKDDIPNHNTFRFYGEENWVHSTEKKSTLVKLSPFFAWDLGTFGPLRVKWLAYQHPTLVVVMR